MSAELHFSSNATDAEAFRRALREARPRPQCLLIAVPVIAAAFVTPSVLLCKVFGLQVIVWAIVASLGSCTAALYRTGRHVERQDLSDPRAGDYLMAAVLTLAAGILLAALALESGPWQERTLSPMTLIVLVISMTTLGTAVLYARALRIIAAQRQMPVTHAQSP